jgi:hypothetical protein
MAHIKQQMQLDKSTKGTHVYSAIGDGNHAVLTVYVQRSALPTTPPQLITLLIEVD